ncbi:uncharacterized protein EV420DRAFT_738416 [Desarmillaria tabescens]|uniref:Fungal-type protein kinase domain-containing protein n=1 Tax=Armillaria tabescens TaxID=1929756 RepID=A0AA39MYH2_ARMTA|nr:uncharacterized protein EV420DRAFT_738416 [Desarmillaria tabescens]KAK0450530.1 hypothetical protein EV420DRAFT_738416 [Desarmillaria tabescens]
MRAWGRLGLLNIRVRVAHSATFLYLFRDSCPKFRHFSQAITFGAPNYQAIHHPVLKLYLHAKALLLYKAVSDCSRRLWVLDYGWRVDWGDRSVHLRPRETTNFHYKLPQPALGSTATTGSRSISSHHRC